MKHGTMRIAASLALLSAAGLLAGCVYDPYTGGYYPCCSYPPPYAYPPYYAPYPPYGPPGYYGPPPGYAEGQPAPAADMPGGEALVRRFDSANVTHDGRLTPQQAEAAGWQQVVRNFPAIDIGQKGYVTLDDIRVWLAAHRPAAARR